MATKKKKKAARKAARKAPRQNPPRRHNAVAKAAPAAAPVVTVVQDPFSFKLPIILAAALVLAWLIVRACTPKAAAPVPVPPPAAAPAPAASPEARSVAPAPAAPTAEAPKPKSSAHREDAGSETGAPSLTFDRAQEKSLKIRCWRSDGGQAQLDVFGPRNRVVAKLLSESGSAGWVDLAWNGKDAAGKKVPEGLYFLRPSQRAEETVRDVWVKD
jgi:hypothetical protein